jgi:NAD(P)-dependent dehydrogenase (short-subunit alcohol dehydrogenase family)
MFFDFQGQRALVTGGTSGIGFGIAQALADAGVDVTATGVSEVSAVEAASRVSGFSRSTYATPTRCNAWSPNSTRSTFLFTAPARCCETDKSSSRIGFSK